ncbi:MAG: glycosyltransferase family 39 protein, partial [Candidatus Promineifilaceae bacterium]
MRAGLAAAGWPSGRLAALLLAAFALRGLNLGAKSLWLDEAFSVWSASRPAAEIWLGLHDNHPPFYYLILRAWLYFGRSEALLRLPSAFASLLAIALVCRLGRRAGGRRVGLWAALLLALAPLDVWYAQEARMALWVGAPAVLMALGLRRGRPAGGLLVALGLGLGLYLDYTIIPLWLLLSGVWLGRLGSSPGRGPPILAPWLLGSAAGWLLFLPQWRHLAATAGRLGETFALNRLVGHFGPPAGAGLLLVVGLAGALALLLAGFASPWLARRLVAGRP